MNFTGNPAARIRAQYALKADLRPALVNTRYGYINISGSHKKQLRFA